MIVILLPLIAYTSMPAQGLVLVVHPKLGLGVVGSYYLNLNSHPIGGCHLYIVIKHLELVLLRLRITNHRQALLRTCSYPLVINKAKRRYHYFFTSCSCTILYLFSSAIAATCGSGSNATNP